MKLTIKAAILALALAAGGCSTLDFKSLSGKETLKNAQGHASGYDLMPLRAGTPLHQEDFTKNAFTVTKYKFTEMHVPSLPTYIVPAEPVANSDTVVWYYSAAHHIPRDEDGRYVNNNFQPTVAQVMWTGFMLKPHDLFDGTPLYP